MNTDFTEIARYASLAPSGHNTQPWRFRIANDTITVIPDPEAALPVVDGDNRELYISLGCAVENLCIAAGHFGYETFITERNGEGITVKLAKSRGIAEGPLFFQIEKRQTNRSIYKSDTIPGEVLERLQSVDMEKHIRFYFIGMGTPSADAITEFILRGNEIQMNDPAFRNELLSCMRFNRKHIEATRNGLSYRVFGNPPLPRLLARPVVKLFLKPDIQNKSDRKKINASSHFVVCTTRQDTIGEWIDLGRTLQRFLLKATETGIACAFLNQPCEVTALASSLREALPVNREYPALILRIGYGKPLPYSPRKKIETLLV